MRRGRLAVPVRFGDAAGGKPLRGSSGPHGDNADNRGAIPAGSWARLARPAEPAGGGGGGGGAPAPWGGRGGGGRVAGGGSAARAWARQAWRWRLASRP